MALRAAYEQHVSSITPQQRLMVDWLKQYQTHHTLCGFRAFSVVADGRAGVLQRWRLVLRCAYSHRFNLDSVRALPLLKNNDFVGTVPEQHEYNENNPGDIIWESPGGNFKSWRATLMPQAPKSPKSWGQLQMCFPARQHGMKKQPASLGGIANVAAKKSVST